MMTLPGAGNYGAAILIGAATGGGNYLLTTAPSKYSPGGVFSECFWRRSWGNGRRSD